MHLYFIKNQHSFQFLQNNLNLKLESTKVANLLFRTLIDVLMDHLTCIPLRIAELMVGFFRNTLTEAENNELNEWLKITQENIHAFDRVAEIAFRANFQCILNDISLNGLYSRN